MPVCGIKTRDQALVVARDSDLPAKSGPARQIRTRPPNMQPARYAAYKHHDRWHPACPESKHQGRAVETSGSDEAGATSGLRRAVVATNGCGSALRALQSECQRTVCGPMPVLELKIVAHQGDVPQI